MQQVLQLTRWLITRVLGVWTTNGPGQSGVITPRDGNMFLGLWVTKSEGFTPDMTMNKLTEFSAAGYERQTLALAGAGVQYTDATLAEAVDCAVAQFVSTDTVAMIARGAFLTDSESVGSGNLAGFVEFLNPRSIGPGSATFDMVLKISINPTSPNGFCITI